MNFRQLIRLSSLYAPQSVAQKQADMPRAGSAAATAGMPILGQVKSVQLPFELKADGAERRISGYASRNTMDRMREIVEPTAFTDMLPNFLQNPVMLWMHKMDSVIGKWDRVEVRSDGLWVSGVIATGVPVAEMVWSLVAQGMLRTLSIGFREIDGVMDDAANIYHITQLELYETSIVSVPMNREALFQMGEGKLLSIELLPESVEVADEQALLAELERRRSVQETAPQDLSVEEAVRHIRPLLSKSWQHGTCAQCDARETYVLPIARSQDTEWSLCARCFLPEELMQALEARCVALAAQCAVLETQHQHTRRAVVDLVRREVQRRAVDLGLSVEATRQLLGTSVGKPVMPATGANGGLA